MRPEDLATNATIIAALQPLQEQLNQLLANTQLASLEKYLSLEQAATLTNFSARTVRKWITVGKADQKGRTVYLEALEFSPGHVRIPLSALIAFGKIVPSSKK